MASATLYPPIVDSSIPSFIAGSSSVCQIYFSLSKFNIVPDNMNAQVSIVRQSTGGSVVNDLKEDGSGGNYYRSSGIILNVPVTEEGENLYSITLRNSDVKTNNSKYTGWVPGVIYKIQIRLSDVKYTPGTKGQAAWINENASHFSEWSTVTVVKPIAPITLKVFGFSKLDDVDKVPILQTLNFRGSFSCGDGSDEYLLSYNIKTSQEDSGEIYATRSQYQEQIFKYDFKREYEENIIYNLVFSYTTNNGYTGSKTYKFKLAPGSTDTNNIKILFYEENPTIMSQFTTPQKEEDDGRLGLKLYSDTNARFSGSIYIRRTSSETNFQEWEDIKIISFNGKINDQVAFYDYTIESGVFYKYGTQIILDTDGTRSPLNSTESQVMRVFEYTYLVGQGLQQLKLKYNNDISSFKINIGEGKADPIGSKFPVFSRGGNNYYKSFPISGLISFNLDDNELFLNRVDAFGSDEIAALYRQYNKEREISMYDYIYEKKFRDAVMKFLYDGNIKLFKSTTEGNLLVRLSEINFQPQKSLNRMIYTFSATATEMAEPTMENYLKYNIDDLKEYYPNTFKN